MITNETISRKSVFERPGCSGKKQWIVVSVNGENELQSKDWWRDQCFDLPKSMYWVKFELENSVSKLVLENILNGIRLAKIVVMGLWFPENHEEEKKHFQAKGLSVICASEQKMATIERMEAKVNQKFNVTSQEQINSFPILEIDVLENGKVDEVQIEKTISDEETNETINFSGNIKSSEKDDLGFAVNVAFNSSESNQGKESPPEFTVEVAKSTPVFRSKENLSNNQESIEINSVQENGWPEHWKQIFKSHEFLSDATAKQNLIQISDNRNEPIDNLKISEVQNDFTSSLTNLKEEQIIKKVKVWDFSSWEKEGIELPNIMHNYQRLPSLMRQDDERLEEFVKHLVASAMKERESMKKQLSVFIELDKEHLKALHIKQRVRSGQVVSSGRDLIVQGMVASGGRVEAVGEIHIYGTFLGTAAAGMSGDEMAEIFISDFQGESIHIGNLGRSFEENEIPKGKMVRFYRRGETIYHEILE